MTSRRTPRIAVVGAGPAGLVCARVLQRHGIEVTVHEVDTATGVRERAGIVDLHADLGQRALREAGLTAELHAAAHPSGPGRRVLTPQGELVVDDEPDEPDEPDEGVGAPSVFGRGRLHAMLAASLEPGTFRWGRRLLSATPQGDGTHRLAFDDGSEARADLVIGADGAWSAVRPLVSATSPAYTGVTFVEAWFRHVDRDHPAVAGLVGSGQMIATGDGKGLIGRRVGEHVRARIVLSAEPGLRRTGGIPLGGTAAVRAELLERFAGYHERLRVLIRDNDGPYVHRPVHVLPQPHTWPHTPGVTLLGDAAHLGSPFRGDGTGHAMLDGAELALCLAYHDDLGRAVAAYETGMWARRARNRDDGATPARILRRTSRDRSVLTDFGTAGYEPGCRGGDVHLSAAAGAPRPTAGLRRG
ncbi:FAD-dependent oxidoreductase [Streptomyces sp. NPDC056188]|uniref:FAD-dependent oxidoreductase n=1 Tax=Streptomyces sp. NPDC056188 TaxID=3345740 RepID=UPI0035DDC39C